MLTVQTRVSIHNLTSASWDNLYKAFMRLSELLCHRHWILFPHVVQYWLKSVTRRHLAWFASFVTRTQSLIYYVSSDARRWTCPLLFHPAAALRSDIITKYNWALSTGSLRQNTTCNMFDRWGGGGRISSCCSFCCFMLWSFLSLLHRPTTESLKQVSCYQTAVPW